MPKARKKSFDWYGTRQHFSIRKYHFGAASVLLGLSLAMNAGAQAVSAQEATVSSSTDTSVTTEAPVSGIDIVLTEPTTAATSSSTAATSTTETVATPATERTATINYIVQYVLEDGTVVHAVAKSTTATTLETLAKATVEVTAELPYAYELATGQLATQTLEVTENAENIVTIKVAKQVETKTSQAAAEAVVETATPATETAVETPASSAAVPAATTPAETTDTNAVAETVKTPATVEEAKVVLEQVVSEAEVLASEATRLVAATDGDNAALKAAATATKLTVTEATVVLNDSKATLEAVNEQINAIRTNVEALALELLKRDKDGVISTSLNLTAGATLGTGTGIKLVDGTTVDVPMDDPNGATVTDAKSGSLQPTATAGYQTFKFIPLSTWYDGTVGVKSGFGASSSNGAYLRASVSEDGSGPLLVELVDRNHNILETHTVAPTESVDFTHFQASALNTPIVVTYSTASASDTVRGTLHATYKSNTLTPNSFIPKPVTNTTTYVTEDGTTLATYSIVTMPGMTTTPSAKRTFSGYEFVETTTSTKVVTEGAPYVDAVRNGYPLEPDGYRGPFVQYKSIIRPYDNGNAITREIWIADPNYTGTHDYLSTTEEGFVRIFTSSQMRMGETNTNYMLDPALIGKYPIRTNIGTYATDTYYEVTNASQLDLSTMTHFSERIEIRFRNHTSELAYITIWPTTIGNYRQLQVQYFRDRENNQDLKYGIRLPITFSYTGVTMTETTHVYRPIPQIAQIIYQTDKGFQLDGIDEVGGNPGESIAYSTASRIAAYEKAGYELVSDGGPQTGQDATFDYTNDDATDPSQKFYVVLKERVVEIPKGSVPGQPVTPTDPNSPSWPAGVDVVTYTEEVTRTITYVDEQGQTVAQTFTDTVNFERKAYVNLVTGEITYGEWTAVNQDNVLDGNPLPEVAGYSVKEATKNGAEATPASTTVYAQVTAETADIVEQVVYTQDTQAAKITISTVDANGENKTEYAVVNETGKHTETVATPTTEEKLVELKRLGYDVVNKVADDFLDSAKTFDNVKDTDGQPSQTYEIIVKERVVDIPNNAVPGQPVDPTDPNSPNWPAGVDQLKLTEEVTRTITYVNEAGEEVAASFTTTVNFTRTAQVNLVTGEITYGEWTATNQDSTLEGNPLPTVTDHHVISATKDGGDVLPATTTIDTPVTAESADIVEKVVYAKDTGSVIIKYKDTDGNTLQEPVVDEDNVLVGTTYDTTNEDNKPSIISTTDGTKYVLVPSKTEGAETGPVTKEDTIVTYVYQKVANWIPVIPGVPADQRPKTEYPFDPTNPDAPIPSTPTNPTTDKPVVPYVDGYIPVGPDGVTPLDPVDPADPSKGYVPPTPDKVSVDTYIPYVKAGSVVINYKDTDGNVLQAPVVDEDKVLVGTGYDTTDEGNKPTTITTADGKFVLIPSRTEGKEKGDVTDGVTNVTYIYQKVANWIPQIPGVPADQLPKTEYPFDPNKPKDPIPGIPTNPTTDKPVVPHVDGFTPYDPVTNTPLPPVDSNDLTKGYIPPKVTDPSKDTLIPYVKDTGSVIIKYIDTEGNTLQEPVVDEDNAPVGTTYDTKDEGNKPTEIVTKDGSKYVLVPAKTEGVENGTVTKAGTTVTYVYQKVANWIPNIPGVPTSDYPEIPYPFDPTNPDVPVTPTPGTVIPNVPGYIPVGPDGVTPLTPVDPEDPSKGYIPPTPENPGVDTPIPYVPVKVGSVVINYKDTDGNVIKAPVTDENKVPVGTSYVTSDEGDKPTEIVTKDGSKYVLVPAKTEGAETGKVTEEGTTVTYVYQKVANWIPEIPGVPAEDRPEIPYPFDPTT
ncbi:TPA: MucBP domain-containing protein, partial [Streptococcus suis]